MPLFDDEGLVVNGAELMTGSLWAAQSGAWSVSLINTGSLVVTGSVGVNNQVQITNTGSLIVSGTFGGSTTPIWTTNTGSQVVTGSVGVNNLVNVSGTAFGGAATPFWVTHTGSDVVTGSVGVYQISSPWFVSATGAIVVTGTTGGSATPIWITNTGSQVVTGAVGISGITIEGNDVDGEATSATGMLGVENHNMVFNGTTWDRQRGTVSGTIVTNWKGTSYAFTASLGVGSFIRIPVSGANWWSFKADSGTGTALFTVQGAYEDTLPGWSFPAYKPQNGDLILRTLDSGGFSANQGTEFYGPIPANYEWIVLQWGAPTVGNVVGTFRIGIQDNAAVLLAALMTGSDAAGRPTLRVSASNSSITPLWVTSTFGSSTNPLWTTNTGSQVITGSVGVNNLVAITASTNAATPLWITGTVATLGGASSVTVTSTGALVVTGTFGSSTTPIWITNTGSQVITGSVGVNNLVNISGTAFGGAATPFWMTHTGSDVVTGSVGVHQISSPWTVSGTFGSSTQPLWTTNTGSQVVTGSVGVTFSNLSASIVTMTDALANPTNAVSTVAHAMGWNGSTWTRIQSEAANADGDNSPTGGLLGVEPYNYVYNATAGLWDRQRGDITGTHVQGGVAAGAAVGTMKPVVIGGIDKVAGFAQVAAVDPSGNLRVAPTYAPTYAVSTSASLTVLATLAANNTASLLTLWHPSGRRAEISTIQVSAASGSAAAAAPYYIRLLKISANGTGGTILSPFALDTSDVATTLQVTQSQVGPASRVATGTPISSMMGMAQAAIGSRASGSVGEPINYYLWDSRLTGKPLVCRAGLAEGYEVIVQTGPIAFTASPLFAVSVYWTEV